MNTEQLIDIVNKFHDSNPAAKIFSVGIVDDNPIACGCTGTPTATAGMKISTFKGFIWVCPQQAHYQV